MCVWPVVCARVCLAFVCENEIARANKWGGMDCSLAVCVACWLTHAEYACVPNLCEEITKCIVVPKENV